MYKNYSFGELNNNIYVLHAINFLLKCTLFVLWFHAKRVAVWVTILLAHALNKISKYVTHAKYVHLKGIIL